MQGSLQSRSTLFPHLSPVCLAADEAIMQVQVLLQQGLVQPSAVQLDAAAVVEHSQKAAALLERFKNSHKRQQAFELQVGLCSASKQAVHGSTWCLQHLTSTAAAGSLSKLPTCASAGVCIQLTSSLRLVAGACAPTAAAQLLLCQHHTCCCQSGPCQASCCQGTRPCLQVLQQAVVPAWFSACWLHVKGLVMEFCCDQLMSHLAPVALLIRLQSVQPLSWSASCGPSRETSSLPAGKVQDAKGFVLGSAAASRCHTSSNCVVPGSPRLCMCCV